MSETYEVHLNKRYGIKLNLPPLDIYIRQLAFVARTTFPFLVLRVFFLLVHFFSSLFTDFFLKIVSDLLFVLFISIQGVYVLISDNLSLFNLFIALRISPNNTLHIFEVVVCYYFHTYRMKYIVAICTNIFFSYSIQSSILNNEHFMDSATVLYINPLLEKWILLAITNNFDCFLWKDNLYNE